MADTIRQQIIGKLDTQLKTIKTTASYETNLGNNIFAGRDLENKPFQIGELPGLNYKDISCLIEPHTFDTDLNTLTIEMVAFEDGSSSLATLRKVIADLIKAIGAKRTWDGLALDSELQTNEIEINQKENIMAELKIPLLITFRTARNDAYTSK